MKTYSASRIFPEPDFPLAIACVTQQPAMVPHTHDYWELVLVAYGHTTHHLSPGEPGESLTGMLQGDIFSIAPGEIHSYSASCNLKLYNISLKQELLATEFAELMELDSCRMLFHADRGRHFEYLHLLPRRRLDAMRCLNRAAHALAVRGPGYRLAARNSLLEFLLTTAGGRTLQQPRASEPVGDRFLEAFARLETEFAQPFSLDKQARLSGMSVPAYTRKFRLHTGLSPLEYCVSLRMEKVRQLLLETDLPLAEIAFATGFCDSNYLIKMFRQRHAITPARYRRQYLGAGPTP